VYGEALAADMAETSVLKPTNPYSASKAAAEMIVNGYVMSHGLPATMIRLNNVMGPHQVGAVRDLDVLELRTRLTLSQYPESKQSMSERVASRLY